MLGGPSTGLVAACLVVISATPAFADCQPYWTAAYRCMMGCGGCPANRGNPGRPTQPAGPSAEEIAHQQRLAASREYNDQGVAAYARGDWAEAVRLQQLALENDPGDAVIANNLSMARARLQEQNDSKAASANIRTLIEGYSATVTPMNSTGGLDFDQGSAAPARGVKAGAQTSQSLDFGDPMVVDARNVPSGLPKEVDDAIASGYSGAPPGVSDRVRKGFQAITNHDWKVARAWFQDALNHDPENAGLKRLTELADFTLTRTSQTKTAKTSSSSGTLQLPESSDMQFLFSNPKGQPASGVALQLPKESDLEYLFPGLAASEAKELSDYTEKHWIGQIETDPQLTHAGRSSPPKSSVAHVKK